MDFVHPSTRHRSRPTVPFILLCVVFFTMPSDLQAGNVLITTSLGEGSHYFVGKTIGKYLVKHGHNVTVLISKAYAYRAENIEDSELNFIVFEQTAEQIASVRERHLAFSKNALEPNNVAYLLKMMKTARQGVADDCDDLLGRNPDVIHQIESGNFDVVVYDMIWLCSLLLAMKINATAVLSSPMSLPTFTAYAHNPVNLAYVPSFMTGYTSSMSFLQRVNNVVGNQGFYPVLEYMNQPFNELRERHKIRPDLTGTISELDLEAFMQSSGDEGVILFTLGTYVSHIKSEFLEPFAEAFGRYPQQKVLWQFAGEPRFKIPPNVKTMSWLPQNDLLGHPKTRLFIFHGGNNGFYETIYHGVPAIIIPLTGDAIDQGVRLKHQGFGIVLDKTRVTVDTLDDAIKTILSNKSYSKMAKVLSSRLSSRSMHPGDRAAFWVNHVMKHGGDYMRSPLKDLNFIQRNLLDVLGLFLVVASIILVIVYNCVRCSFRRCKRIFFSSKQKND
ncbi:UDP-glucuronosyltransferase 1A1-like isoform X3 [Lytechinus variegatus]|uniref:UDP-glucuronosyltransferase 1A1-like isoform X3 n=1 Tax=Lytechinus variegatus TaxID=7654 RepID=UPI001BB28F18|nr:UDP-glucuronosyltransferase 1A1-like isoform X3 [Lytechinus variegatus]